MAGHYAYLVGGVDDRFSSRVAIVCDDDEETTLCQKVVDGHAIEWHKPATFELER